LQDQERSLPRQTARKAAAAPETGQSVEPRTHG
jgi:hypothetical protein